MTRILAIAGLVLAVTIAILSIGPIQNRLTADGSDDLVWNANGALVAPLPPPVDRPAPPDGGCTDEPATTCFEPVLYAVDTVVPLVDLDQRATWHVNGEASGAAVVQFFLDIARLLGWLVVAAITFVARHFQTRHG